MSSKGDITHEGKVVAVNPQFTTVEITSSSACASCHAAGLCGMGEVQEKAIQVPTGLSADYAVGEQVEVVLKATMGLKAVWLAYAVPLFILLAVVLVLLRLGLGELLSAGAGLGAVALYYFIIWLLRARLRNTYVFTLRKLNKQQ